MAVILQNRNVVGFTEVILQGTGTIHLRQAEQDSLDIEAEESLQPRIKSDVQGYKLVIGRRSWTDRLLPWSDLKIDYYVGMRKIQAVTISGSGSLVADRIQAQNLRMWISGSGNLAVADLQAEQLAVLVSGQCTGRLAGKIRQQDIQISGAANYDAFGLECEDVVVHISGFGELRLAASNSLKAQISGSGKVVYSGSPTLNQQITGSGIIECRSALDQDRPQDQAPL